MQWLYQMDKAPTNIKSSTATHSFFQSTFYAHYIPFMCAQLPAINLRQLPSISQKFRGFVI